MRTWNNNFDTKTKVNGKTIIVGEQNFENNTLLVKEENGNIISCPMRMDKQGDIYFLYDNTEVYLRWI